MCRCRRSELSGAHLSNEVSIYIITSQRHVEGAARLVNDQGDRPVENDIGRKLRLLRNRHHLSMRQLAKLAGVTTSYIAGLEAGRTSPTISTLRKLLTAMETDLGEFFSTDAADTDMLVFRQEAMRMVEDADRRYTFTLPRRPNIHVEVVEEYIRPDREKPEFETLHSDLAGFVLDGDLVLEVENQEPQLLRPRDAFYVPAGRPVRGWASEGDQPVRMITIYTPPRY